LFGESDTTIDLPADLLSEIGRIIVSFAKLEFMLTRLAYALLELDRTAGRIVVREPRACERFDMIVDLLRYRNLSSESNLNALRISIGQCEDGRNLVAHGTWVRDPVYGVLRIVKTSGQWQPIPSYPRKTKRKVAPEGVEFELPDALELSEKIQLTIKSIERWADEFRQPPTSL
jgi:hypothetical protein